MVIVMTVTGLVAAIVAAVFYRRYRRRQEERDQMIRIAKRMDVDR